MAPGAREHRLAKCSRGPVRRFGMTSPSPPPGEARQQVVRGRARAFRRAGGEVELEHATPQHASVAVGRGRSASTGAASSAPPPAEPALLVECPILNLLRCGFSFGGVDYGLPPPGRTRGRSAVRSAAVGLVLSALGGLRHGVLRVEPAPRRSSSYSGSRPVAVLSGPCSRSCRGDELRAERLRGRGVPRAGLSRAPNRNPSTPSDRWTDMTVLAFRGGAARRGPPAPGHVVYPVEFVELLYRAGAVVDPHVDPVVEAPAKALFLPHEHSAATISRS